MDRKSPILITIGFSLIELGIAIAVILTLTAILIPTYLSSVSKSKNDKAVADLRKISADVRQYWNQYGIYPSSLSVIKDDTLLDPWGNPYQFLIIAGASNGQVRKDRNLHPISSEYDLYSKGSDGKSTPPLTANISQDDVIRASDGWFFGLASDF